MNWKIVFYNVILLLILKRFSVVPVEWIYIAAIMAIIAAIAAVYRKIA